MKSASSMSRRCGRCRTTCTATSRSPSPRSTGGRRDGTSAAGYSRGITHRRHDASQRVALVRRPPHILVTTPESLYLMLTAAKSRETLRNVDTVIVDEIHAMVGNKRGSHLSISLERLERLCGKRLQRIGLSATQKPIERTANFLVGAGAEVGNATSDANSATTPDSRRQTPDAHCQILDVGHARERAICRSSCRGRNSAWSACTSNGMRSTSGSSS